MKKCLLTWLFLLCMCACFAQLHILTYNIRYDNPGDAGNAWPHRRQALADSVLLVQPDLICMQEVLNSQYVFLQQQFHTYGHYGIGRDDGKTAGEYSPVFFRKDKFTLLDSGAFWLSDTPAKPTRGWDAALNRIVTWVKLETMHDKKVIYVFNTHFDHKGMVARVESARLIAAKAKVLAGNSPVILCGDYNFTPAEEPYAVITFAAYEDAFAVNKEADAYTFTGFKTDLAIAKRIDYVFYNKAWKAVAYKTFQWKAGNGSYLSDHLPVYVVLNMQ